MSAELIQFSEMIDEQFEMTDAEPEDFWQFITSCKVSQLSLFRDAILYERCYISSFGLPDFSDFRTSDFLNLLK
jgi:hypothetical protein